MINNNEKNIHISVAQNNVPLYSMLTIFFALTIKAERIK